MKRIMMVIIGIMVLAGCSSMGEDKFSARYVKAHIVNNKTTQAEVKALYGAPYDQSTYDDGSSRWYYKKGEGGALDAAVDIISYVPGASAVMGTIHTAQYADNAATNVTAASDKLSGNTEHSGKSLSVRFNENKIVTSWSLL